MKNSTRLAAALFAALTLTILPSAQSDPVASSDTFGSGANTFTIDFVDIGNTNNAADTTGYGAVPYEYRMGTYEISQNAIDKATASGLTNVTAGAWIGIDPAANISWYEAAAFVNWLSDSTGKQKAYDLTFSNGSWSMALWSNGLAWTAGGTNLYRHKDAQYFLPSENEWYKAAYYNPGGANYFDYPTGSDTAPTAVASGTSPGTAVFGFNVGDELAPVTSAGGLSPYGTMGQGGNVWEWNETASDGNNSSPSEARLFCGSSYANSLSGMASSFREGDNPTIAEKTIGFRVASFGVTPIPEPGTWIVAALLVSGAAFMSWRKR
ncbi:MAG: SUMF1/EgtB/PvdO family nonheme iron enzyme [Chthoniobacterales bacterium]